jgi:hypothetical protein
MEPITPWVYTLWFVTKSSSESHLEFMFASYREVIAAKAHWFTTHLVDSYVITR